jgi:hypothetical protein
MAGEDHFMKDRRTSIRLIPSSSLRDWEGSNLSQMSTEKPEPESPSTAVASPTPCPKAQPNRLPPQAKHNDTAESDSANGKMRDDRWEQRPTQRKPAATLSGGLCRGSEAPGIRLLKRQGKIR